MKPGSPLSRQRGEVIAGVFLLLGALIAFIGPVLIQQRDQRREDHRSEQDATGAARMLFAEYLQAASQMAILANDRILRRFDSSYRVEMRAEDMRLVASRIDMEGWGLLQESMSNIEQLETFVNTLLERGRRRLTEGEVCYVLMDLRSIRIAAGALAPLAHATGEPPLPEPIECEPKPGPVPKGLGPSNRVGG